MLAPLLLAALLRTQVRFALAGISVNPVAHQRVGRIEHALHLAYAMVVLAFGNVALGEGEIIQDPVRVGPLPEDVVVLEEMVVAEGRVGEHGRLHRGGVLLHDVDDAGIGIDDDFVGEALPTLAVERLVACEMLAEGPVLVEEGHPGRGVCIEHLFSGDHLDLSAVGVEADLVYGDALHGIMDAREGREIPFGTRVEQLRVAYGRRHQRTMAGTASALRSKSSRKTG